VVDDFRSQNKFRPILAENGRYLLSRMLVIDPERRISVEEALKQSYVSRKNRVGELSSPPRGEYDRNVELETFSTNEWKSKI
jgi:mitogen-activated protein kinase 8/9/10 (c-Jun N-terminal kinase)